jgi:1-deoxy-D-xylulose-5-phosphate reductoisomerase
VEYGPEAVTSLAAIRGVTVVNGIVGVAGLDPTLAALDAGNRLALANKESLVAGGGLVNAARRRSGAELIPVDSEHSAIHQVLLGESLSKVATIYLTASGGPFREASMDEMAAATPAAALRHPNWQMGDRITIDSATLVNKGLEVIEAHFMFALTYDQIEVLVHPQSIVHSMVEFSDGSVKAQLGPPDMRLPIEYALTHPDRGPRLLPEFSWVGQTLTFDKPDLERFPALGLAYQAGRRGGSAPATFNAADEVAVAAFLQGRIGFTGITRVIDETLELVEVVEPGDLETVVAVDREARSVAMGLIPQGC